MAFSITFSSTASSTAKIGVFCMYDNKSLSIGANKFDSAHDGYLNKIVAAHSGFKAKAGDTLSLAAQGKGYDRIVLLGLGEANKLDTVGFETIGGKLYTALKNDCNGTAEIHLFGIEDSKTITPAESAAHLALGIVLRSYDFDKYKTKKKEEESCSNLSQIIILTENAHAAQNHFSALSAVAEGVFLARNLVNEPPNILHPESYAEIIKDELKPLGVGIEILDEKKMQKLGFGALLSVGQGSVRESKVVIMTWNGTGKMKKESPDPIAFVGKGVTFDTGGISIKPADGMDLMKMDMGGSAAVVGVMKTLALRKAKVNAIGIVGLVENMPSGHAYRPGDILTSLSGKTIEVLNTDAEGRLVLADILTYVQDTYKPSVVIDLATLTGAIMVALGFEYCGTFSNDDSLWDKINTASKSTGEKFWRMPLDESYRKEMESDVADLKNLGNQGRYGGACSAAGFLQHFITEGTKWMHIDIAGTAWWKTDKPTTPKGGTGFAVRTLNELVEKNFEQ